MTIECVKAGYFGSVTARMVIKDANAFPIENELTAEIVSALTLAEGKQWLAEENGFEGKWGFHAVTGKGVDARIDNGCMLFQGTLGADESAGVLNWAISKIVISEDTLKVSAKSMFDETTRYRIRLIELDENGKPLRYVTLLNELGEETTLASSTPDVFSDMTFDVSAFRGKTVGIVLEQIGNGSQAGQPEWLWVREISLIPSQEPAALQQAAGSAADVSGLSGKIAEAFVFGKRH